MACYSRCRCRSESLPVGQQVAADDPCQRGAYPHADYTQQENVGASCQQGAWRQGQGPRKQHRWQEQHCKEVRIDVLQQAAGRCELSMALGSTYKGA